MGYLNRISVVPFDYSKHKSFNAQNCDVLAKTVDGIISSVKNISGIDHWYLIAFWLLRSFIIQIERCILYT